MLGQSQCVEIQASDASDPSGHSFCYSVAMNRFIIVYAPTENGIRVVRLLHGVHDWVSLVIQEMTTRRKLDWPCRSEKVKKAEPVNGFETPSMAIY